MKLKHASFFSGEGGFDLAAEREGYENAFHVENNPFCQRILSYYWPKAIQHGNITTTDFSEYRNQIYLASGGFPCQPFSTAGSRKGKDDHRYLWPENFRALKETRPPWFIGENVTGLTSMVFGSSFIDVEIQTYLEGKEIHRTMGSDGILLRIIQDLESIGYDVQPFVIPACAKNAPHRRDRVWLVAYNEQFESEYIAANTSKNGSKYCAWKPKPQRLIKVEECGFLFCSRGTSPYSNSLGLRRKANRIREPRLIDQESKTDYWSDFPTQPPICPGDDGISSQLDGITFSKFRRESIKSGGNAIVPQIAQEIIRNINLVSCQHQQYST